MQCSGGNDLVESATAVIARAEQAASNAVQEIVEGFATVEACNGCVAATQIISTEAMEAVTQAVTELEPQVWSLCTTLIKPTLQHAICLLKHPGSDTPEVGVQITEFVPLPLRDSTELIFEFVNAYAALALEAFVPTFDNAREAAVNTPDGETCAATPPPCTVTVERALEELPADRYASIGVPVPLYCSDSSTTAAV